MLYFDYFESQIFWLLTTFSLFYLYSKYVFFSYIKQIFDKRSKLNQEHQNNIENTLIDIEKSQSKNKIAFEKEKINSANIVSKERSDKYKKLSELKLELDKNFADFAKSNFSKNAQNNLDDQEIDHYVKKIVKSYNQKVR
jgi:F0F1-type ATP synthase membrane subunit b/b'